MQEDHEVQEEINTAQRVDGFKGGVESNCKGVRNVKKNIEMLTHLLKKSPQTKKKVDIN